MKTDWAREWTREAQFLATAWRRRARWRPTHGKKVIVDWWVFWETTRTHDPSNLEKVMFDALEGILYDNDKWVLPRCQDFALDRKNPRVELVLRIKPEEDATL